MKVLVVDDSPLFTSKLLKGLDEALVGTIAENGRLALNEFYTAHKKGDPYDIIFLDLDMPTMRGEDALHAIRSYEECMHITPVKVIVISANSDSKKAIELFNIGSDYYITKPLKRTDVENALEFIYKGSENITQII
jgi:two-component system, chemotaxis family, chemotaxis protein CheY